jgi:branched-chain amino acid transport system permease protein
MELLESQALAGLATGSIYALLGLALVMTYRATGHLNFAQGEIATFSTFIAWQLMAWGVPYWLAFLLTLAVSFLIGFTIERILFSWPREPMHPFKALVLSIALFNIFNSMSGYFWDFNVKTFPTPFGGRAAFSAGLLGPHEAGMIGTSLCFLACLDLFFRYTRVGLAMRAAAGNPDSARLAGINVEWTRALGCGMGAMMAAAAGLLIAPVVFLDPNMMRTILLYAFAGAVLGGLASPLGAVVCGVLTGLIENGIGLIPFIGQELKLTCVLALIIAALIIMPRGLFGRRTASRV